MHTGCTAEQSGARPVLDRGREEGRWKDSCSRGPRLGDNWMERRAGGREEGVRERGREEVAVPIFPRHVCCVRVHTPTVGTVQSHPKSNEL